MSRTRLGRAGALVAVVAAMALAGFTQSAAADNVVCTASAGDCWYWEPPSGCHEITPQDEAEWNAYIYDGGPPPTRDLPFAECIGF